MLLQLYYVEMSDSFFCMQDVRTDFAALIVSPSSSKCGLPSIDFSYYGVQIQKKRINFNLHIKKFQRHMKYALRILRIAYQHVFPGVGIVPNRSPYKAICNGFFSTMLRIDLPLVFAHFNLALSLSWRCCFSSCLHPVNAEINDFFWLPKAVNFGENK